MPFQPRRIDGLAVLSLVLVLTGCLTDQIEWQRRMLLTAEHGEEAREAIERFEQTWLSKEVLQNPTLQYEVATQQWTEHMGIKEPSRGGLVRTSATVRNISVIEYTPERFKSTACRTITFDDLDREGKLIQSGQFSQCGTYVFWKLDGTWKLAGYLDNADRRYWSHTSPWLKEVMGDLTDD